MALHLTIDQGNSAAKLALWDGEELVDIKIVHSLTSDVLRGFISSAEGTVDSAIYCSVASKGTEVVAWLENMVRKVVRLQNGLPLPIAIDYGTPGSLGADRIAAAVGARVLFPDSWLLVVDAGTAVTYDAVTPEGKFVGGNIAPGMNMRLEALHRFTARLPRVEMPRELPEEGFLGHDTASAMILGAVYGIVGAVSYYHSHLPEGTKVVMTGGWASELSRLCDVDSVIVEPNLVSKGLNRILIYNENI
ncbi:MAG: type III pantothenate kinase [Paramuribaculum sp.]|nr:type III pantothenate kinase [Paramuribaculum sp.]